MQSKATTVSAYLASLPAERKAAMEAVRKVILANLDKGFVEGMQYGMIGYYVPHAIFPAGYHCDPKQPLPFAGLASQKGHMSLYIMGIYGHAPLREWFQAAWAKTGKRLDMGKACIRFRKVEDLPLAVVGEAFRRMTLKGYVAAYTDQLASQRGAGPARKTSVAKNPGMKNAAAKKVAKKSAKKGASNKAGTAK